MDEMDNWVKYSSTYDAYKIGDFVSLRCVCACISARVRFCMLFSFLKIYTADRNFTCTSTLHKPCTFFNPIGART